MRRPEAGMPESYSRFQKFEAFASVRFPEKLDDGERKGHSETDQQKTFSQREEAEVRQDKHAIDRFGDPDCENLPPPCRAVAGIAAVPAARPGRGTAGFRRTGFLPGTNDISFRKKRMMSGTSGRSAVRTRNAGYSPKGRTRNAAICFAKQEVAERCMEQ